MIYEGRDYLQIDSNMGPVGLIRDLFPPSGTNIMPLFVAPVLDLFVFIASKMPLG